MIKLLLENWKLKLLAVGIALVLWMMVVGQDHAETSLQIPLVLVNMPPKMLILGDVPNEVVVRISGPRILVGQAAEDEKKRMVINLEGMKAGQHVFQLTTDKLKLPPNVSIIRISPAYFQMTLVPRENREVQVRPVLKGDPAPGFEIEEITFDPAVVTVFGAKNDLENLDWIWTLPLDVSGLDETETVDAILNLPDGRSLSLEHPTVKATIKLRAAPGSEPSGDNGAPKANPADEAEEHGLPGEEGRQNDGAANGNNTSPAP